MSCGLFQSTHPSGVRQRGHGFLLKGSLFQSTHPSGVRPYLDVDGVGGVGISIHAPQWGATGLHRFNEGQRVISIHAPQWGATDRSCRLPDRPRDFNPRTPVGCDLWSLPACSNRIISIHAPQWGATTTLAVDPAPVQFQSTHPSGVRLNYRVWRPNIVIISIHAPQWGATVFSGGVSVTGVISIHAPQWGATGCRSIGMVRW